MKKKESKSIDIVYENPFSSTTDSIRRKMVTFSLLSIINNYFPIDITNSHLLGIHFAKNSPPLTGVIGYIVLYFAVSFTIYTVHEIFVWFARCRLFQFEEQSHLVSHVIQEADCVRVIDDVESARSTVLSYYNEAIATLRQARSDYKSAMIMQIIRVGVLEVIFPYSVAFIALYFSFSGMREILLIIIN